MTTPWERIKDDAYRAWLLERQITAEEYNTVSLVDRSALRTQFDDTLSPPQPNAASDRSGTFQGRPGYLTILGPVDVNYEALFPHGSLPPEGKMDLSALEGLRVKDEPFLPVALYVRPEMITILNMLEENEIGNVVKAQIMLGSPGVGKSIVGFLHALRRAYAGQKVLFFRKSQAEDHTSLWCMEKHGDSFVRIRFNRVIDKVFTISQMRYPVMLECFPHSFPKGQDGMMQLAAHAFQSREVLVFVDGPNHADKEDTLFGNAHYLFTSGGHPYLKDEEIGTKRLVVMNGWEQQDFKKALATVKTDAGMKALRDLMNENREQDDMEVEGEDVSDDDVYDFVFYHFGGRIRRGAHCVSGRYNLTTYTNATRAMISSVSFDSITLCLESTDCSADGKSKDSLRTMFRDEVGSLQIVDSQFIMTLLRNKVSTSQYLNAYKKAVKENRRAVAGYHFEELLHSVFCGGTHRQEDSPIQESHQASGNGQESVKQLSRRFMYWMPSTVNFANIDAALIDASGIIFCPQYTVGADHGFNGTTLRTKFLRRIPVSVQAQTNDNSCTIVFVVPNDVTFTAPDTDPFPHQICYIDCTNMETVIKDAAQVFSGAQGPNNNV